ncbi:MAG: hypothetical protein H6712_07275 [Myxococcales bacterium]|nr:hypothetical protein [Myxococcales bacterium]MCB9713635.1 hypothetical protein [Myxococcales bacterium]
MIHRSSIPSRVVLGRAAGPRTAPRPRAPGRPSSALLSLLVLVATVLVTACRGGAPRAPFDPRDPQAQAERLRAYLAEHPEDDAAWRDLAHVQWMYLGQTDEAVPVLDRLAEGGDPVARISRLVIASWRDEPEVVQAQAFATIRALAEGDPEDREQRLRVAAAEHAARVLGDTHGDLEGDDGRVSELLDGMAVERLPFAVAQPLLSLRAAISRRHGDDYRALYAKQGCVQDWQAGPVQGSRGEVELAHAEPGPITPDPEAPVVPLACVVRLWNPQPSPGIRRMATHLRADGGPVLIDLGAEDAARFYLDGTPLLRTDGIERYAPRRVTLRLSLEPGWHRLEAHTAVPGDNAWVMVRAVEPDGTPLAVKADDPGALAAAWTGRARRARSPWPEEVPGIEGPLYAPLRAYLAVDDALAEGDSDRAERRVPELTQVEAFAEGHAMRARFERADPSRGRTVSLSREVEALERALELDPRLDRVRLRLLDIQLDRGEDAEVEQALLELPKGQLAGVDGELLRFNVFLAQGNEFLAEQALRRAMKRSPRGCKVLLARRSLARERADVRAEDEISEAMSVCAGSLALRARLAESRGHWEEASALWAEALDRAPDDLPAHESQARVLALRGMEDQARTHLRESMRYNPFRVGSHLALADLAATHGDMEGARAELRAALRKIPHSNALWQAAADLGLHDDLLDFRVDGAEALAEYRASGATYEGVGEVLVLDRSVARVYDNGGQRQIVHIVAHLLSKEKLDEYGELSIPEGAELLALRSIKPDGRTLEPEIVPGKEGVSLRHLEIGDVVEYEFIVERGPAGAVPGYVDVSTFRFQSADVPYHRSELLVVHPPSMELRHDDRNAPPVDEPRTVEIGGEELVVHHWRAEEVPRLGVEPGMRHWLEELPSVHVYTALDLPRYLDGLAAQIRGTQRRNPALRALVRELTRGHAEPRAKLEALWTWVVENVEDAGDLSTPASATLAARTGSRLMLLRAMLREAGMDAELWLARDAYGPRPLPDGHPLVDGYEAAMLAVTLPDADEPLMVLTASKVMPLGYLAPGYRETAGLRIHLEPHEGAAGPVTLPDIPPGLDDRRRYDLSLELDAKGKGTVEGTITLYGMEALMWRQALRQIDRDRVEEVFEQAELGWLPGATLTDLSLEGEDDLAGPLTLRFAARSPSMGVTQDGELVLRAVPLPLNPGAPFAALPQRETGLLVPYSPKLEAELRYRVKGAALRDPPQGVAIDTEHGSFVREVEAGGAGELTLRVRSTLRTGVVEPRDYPGLARFVREVDRAMQDVLRAQ